MTRTFRITTFALVVALALLCRPVAAESILITMGGVGFDITEPPGLGLFGEGLSVFTLFPSVGSISALQCGYPNPCPPGTPLDLTTEFGGEGGDFRLGNGRATIDGVAYAPIELRGTLIFESSTVIIPTATDRTIFLTAPVVMHGQIAGFPVEGLEPLFERNVHGTGRVALELFGVGVSQPPYTFLGISYGLSSEPVPEPATMLLVGTALTALATGRAMSRRTSSCGAGTNARHRS
jgi:hypothetical protein